MGEPTIRASNLFKVRTLTRSTMKWLGMYPFRAVYIPLAFATWACGSQGLGLFSLPLVSTIGVWSLYDLRNWIAEFRARQKG